MRSTDIAYLVYLFTFDTHDSARCFVHHLPERLNPCLIAVYQQTYAILGNLLLFLYFFALRHHLFLKSSIQNVQAVRLVYLAFGTYPVITFFALKMIFYIDIVVVMAVAFIAYKWLEVWLKLFMVKTVTFVDDPVWILNLTFYALVQTEACVPAFPDAA